MLSHYGYKDLLAFLALPFLHHKGIQSELTFGLYKWQTSSFLWRIGGRDTPHDFITIFDLNLHLQWYLHHTSVVTRCNPCWLRDDMNTEYEWKAPSDPLIQNSVFRKLFSFKLFCLSGLWTLSFCRWNSSKNILSNQIHPNFSWPNCCVNP